MSKQSAMPRSLGQQLGFEMFSVNATANEPLDELAALMNEAWRHDYKGEVRMVYDAEYLKWVLGTDWGGLSIRESSSGELVGFVYSLGRTVAINRKTYKSVYTSGLTVSPRFRQRGLSRWTHEVGASLMFEDTQSGVEVAALQVGHAGLLATERNAARARLGTNVLLPPCNIWSKRVLAQEHAGDGVTISRVYSTQDHDGALNVPRVAELFASTAMAASVAFLPKRNFVQLYLREHESRSGTLYLQLEDGSDCAMTFTIVTLAIDDDLIGDMAQVQSIYGDLDPRQLTLALDAVTSELAHWGCMAISVVVQRPLNHEALQTSGFTKSSDHVIWSLRARPERIAGLGPIEPHYALDFL